MPRSPSDSALIPAFDKLGDLLRSWPEDLDSAHQEDDRIKAQRGDNPTADEACQSAAEASKD
jgi:hypothetical protein